MVDEGPSGRVRRSARRRAGVLAVSAFLASVAGMVEFDVEVPMHAMVVVCWLLAAVSLIVLAAVTVGSSR